MALRHGLDILTGLPALSGFSFDSENRLEYKTLITQEMLKPVILLLVALSTEHTTDILDAYLEKLDPIFALISECERGNRSVHELLEGPVCQSGFKRLN